MAKFSPDPSMVIWSLFSVVCVPASWSGVRRPWMTWCSSTDVSWAVSAISGWSVSGGTASKAGLSGASRVRSGAVFSESTRLAWVTARARVDSAGLALAAVTTGTVAMPAKLPAPSAGTPAQPTPNGAVDAAGAELSLVGALEELDDALLSEEPPELQALSVIARPEVTAMATPRLRKVLVTWVSSSGPVDRIVAERRGRAAGQGAVTSVECPPGAPAGDGAGPFSGCGSPSAGGGGAGAGGPPP